MQESKTREKVLKKIRHALLHKTAEPFPNLDFDSPSRIVDDDAGVVFARRFTRSGGQFVFCEEAARAGEVLSDLAVRQGWKRLAAGGEGLPPQVLSVLDGFGPADGTCDAVVTGCLALVAESGTVLYGSTGGRSPATGISHVVVASVDQVVPRMKEALQRIGTAAAQGHLASVTASGGSPIDGERLFLLLVDEP